jgi:predicted metal-dependent hydrolase
VSSNKEEISALVSQFEGSHLDARYLAYFECFNRQLFYEAHEVLEKLWLERRGQPDAEFYKGLIQLAGAFVHLKRGRLKPAASLLRRAQQILQKYPKVHHQLDLGAVETLIQLWRATVEAPCFEVKEIAYRGWPRLESPQSRI